MYCNINRWRWCSYPGGPNNGGAGGSVKATINDPEMGGTTWDIMVAGGGYKNATPQLPTGGIGGGGHGVHCQGGGASVIFNGEATIQPGCMTVSYTHLTLPTKLEV